MSLHATVPEDAVRLHMAHEAGLELAAICSYDGTSFSQGAVACMAERRMAGGADGIWVADGDC